jgi:hypothetical protein
MRRFILWIAAILITFAIGVGADKLWWYFLAAPPVTPVVEPVAVEVAVPQREVVSVPAPTPQAAPSPKLNLVFDSDEDYNLSGVFFIIGPKPKEFADIESMDIWLNPGSDNSPGGIQLNTLLDDMSHYDGAPATFALVTERRIFFVTSQLSSKHFEYRFDGEFLRKDFDKVAQTNTAVLRGVLTKTRNGRTVAQHEFTFRMEFEGC